MFGFSLSLKPWPFVQSVFDMNAPRQRNAVSSQLSVSSYLCLIFFVSWEMSLFLNISVPLLFNALYGEYVVHIPLPDRVYLSCGHGLDFGLISLRDNSNEQKSYFIRHTAEISCVCTNNKISCRQATYLYESSQLSCVSGHIYNLILQIAQKSTYSLYFYYISLRNDVFTLEYTCSVKIQALYA